MEDKGEYNSSLTKKADSFNLTTIAWRNRTVKKLLQKNHILTIMTEPTQIKTTEENLQCDEVILGMFTIIMETYSPSSLPPSKSSSQGWPETHCITKASLELMELLSQSPRHESSPQAVFWHRSSKLFQCHTEVFHNKANFPNYLLNPSKPNLVFTVFTQLIQLT